MAVTAIPAAQKQAAIDRAYAFASVLSAVDGSIAANGPYMGFYCGGSGDVTVTRINDTGTVTFKRVPVGTVIPVQFQGLQSTGTTATDIVGLG